MPIALSNLKLDRISKIAWGLVVLSLPLTTFRYVPSFYGFSSVRPLALYPLAILLLMLAIKAWRSKKLELPKIATPILAFLFAALVATLLGFLLDPLELRGQSYAGRALRAWFSVAVGLMFFLSAYWMNKSKDDIKYTLRWMYAGLVASIIWGGIQIAANKFAFIDIAIIEKIQLSFSLRGLPDNYRIVGFAFEPAWLADQIVIFYYPWLFSALITGYRVFKYRWVEPGLFILGSVLLVFTFSRGGVLIAILAVGATILIVGRKQIAAGWNWLWSPFRNKDPKQSFWRAAAIRTLLLISLLIGFTSAARTFSENRYFSSFLEFDSTTDLYKYMLDVSAGPRLAYAASGLNIYTDHPWTGVGLGASPLYLYDNLPDWALTNLPEINRRLSPDSPIVTNVKNLYIRLLAETGIIGFWFYSAFFLSILAEIRQLYKSNKDIARYVATAGLFIWIAIGLRNFTQDSFTFPIMWVSIGVVLGISSNHKS
ncbi:MAG: O-antigen ligase family protein [Chloroflexota bacterium]